MGGAGQRDHSGVQGADPRRHRFDVQFHRAPGAGGATDRRITSYNVCYTKLLRTLTTKIYCKDS